MLLIAGTVPTVELPFVSGKVEMQGNNLFVEGYSLPCAQGTTAMVSAALAVTTYLNLEPPYVVLAGDLGSGEGSRQIYCYLIEHIAELSPRVLALHYIMPDLELMKKLVAMVDKCQKRPILIADAGSMYTAKAVGVAPQFDIFTPDPSEIAFLADPEAIHPAYINKHLFDADIDRVPELIKKAYEVGGAAKVLLVKGSIDYIGSDGEIIATVDQPDVPELECIGGTGDTITGMVAALSFAEIDLVSAALISARANRLAGKMAGVSPASRVGELISLLPRVFRENLCSWCGVCSKEGYHVGG
ncbi:MAG: Sugar kinase [Thermoanaerobacterales bacterium 50_218]|nr:MAG: Sugar kinase [Thermoanaerobacterales bacterium 50_218]